MSSRVLIRAGMGLVAVAALLVCFGAYNDAAFAQMPTVLVIDDDSGKADVGNGRELAPRDPATRGLSAEGMAAHLTLLGYDVTLETSATSDPATWPDYDFIISSTGNSTTPLAQTYMDNLVLYVQGGGKLLIEGGEVGYNHQTGDFATQVLHILDWDTDNAGTLDLHPDQTGHPIANAPNALPASITLTYSGYGDMDANEIATDAYVVYGTTNYPDDCGVLVYDDNPNPVSAQIVYYAFNWAAVDNRGTADNLLENTAAFLTAEETGPTAGISGYVDLTDTGDDSGVLMELTGPSADNTTTDATGYYEFTGLYPGSYNVTATPPAGYFPESSTQSGIVVEDVMVTDVNFTFDPMVLGSVAGTVTLENNPDASGVVVEILGQGISMVTGSDGIYLLTGVTPGNITVRASKEGYATETRFEFLDNGGALVGIDFFLGESGGAILVIDDDYVRAGSRSNKVGKPRDEATRGLSAAEMAAHLTSLGYTVTEEQSGTSDPGTWTDYDLVVSSTGANTADLTQQYRDDLTAYVQGGGKLLIEGGEVGYNHYSDPFAGNVLHINDWDSDNAGPLTIVPGQEAHPIATTPNTLPTSMPITYSGYGDEDANDPTPDAFHVYAPANYMTHCGINVYDDTPEPTSAQIVYFAFNWFVVQTSTDRDNLLENTVAFLLAEETGGLGSITGVADLTDTGDDSGTHVVLTGIVNDEVYTGPDGSFTFTGLFDGSYTITMTPPAGYYPYETEVTDIAVAAGPVDIGTYAFDPIVGGTVSGTASLSDNPDWSGITVEVIGQGISMVTGSDGLYELTGVAPGDITVKASKDGYRSGVEEVFMPNGGTITGLDFLLEPGTDEFFTDFEDDNGGFASTGTPTAGWEWGSPSNGPSGAYSGVNLWGTRLAADYEIDSDYRLESISVDVSGFANVLLKFWHWYDTESYFDGGNVKVSTDGGATWTIVEPVDGYPEDATSTGNAGIPGEPAYSGHDQGFWELAQFNLNAYAGATDLMIRWHFGSDYSVQYPGWYIDDVAIVDDVVKLPPENLVATGGLENHVPLDWTHPEETPKSFDYNDLRGITGPDADLEITKRSQIPAADRMPHERVIKDGRPVIGYHVYRSETSGGPYVDESGLITPSDYDDTNVVNGTPYYYVVTADYGAFGESDATPEVSATPENNPPPVPQNLTATVVDRDVTLNWDPVVAYDLDGYNVYRKQDEGDWMLHASTPAGTETFMETLAIDGVFQYRVTSFDNHVPPAESGPSNTVTVAMGILPPTFLTADSGYDGHIPLSWREPGTSDFPPYEISYDDGTFENGLALNAAANGLAVRFTPLGYPFTVDTGKWYVSSYGLPTAPLTVRVYDDDGPVAGGTILAEATGISAGAGEEWVEYTFDSPVTINEGDFYVACIWEIGANPGPTSYVGLDENGTFEDRTWLIIDSGATWSQDELHAYFPNSEIGIRCIGRGPVPKGADLAVESYELEPTAPRRVEGSSSLALGQASLFGPAETVNEAPHFIFSQNATKETLMGYNLYRSETSPVPVDPANFIGSTAPDVLEYDDWGPGGMGLSNGTEYFYVATADYGPDGESGPSGEASAIPENAPPPDPENLVATLVDRDVTLDWDPVVVYDLNSYNVYRSFNYGDFMLHANVPTETFTENLVLDGVYKYKVTSVDNDGGESGFSNVVTVAVGILPPRNLRAQSGYDGNIPLTWSEPGGTGGIELNILLVSDPADGVTGTIENYDAVYTHGFETAGLGYTVWDHQTQGEPTLTDLQDYNCIFWYTATSGGTANTHATLSLAEEQTLVDWLNLGDRFLVLSGIWIAWDCIADATNQVQLPSTLFDDYIFLSYPPENFTGWISVSNSWYLDGQVNPIGQDLDWPINWVCSENYPDQLESTVPAAGNEVYTWMDPNVSHHQGGISYDGGSFKTVLLACPVEQVGTEADKDLLIGNMLNWFGGTAKELDLSMLATETVPVKADPGTANLGQTCRATGKGNGIDMSVAPGYYPAPLMKENNVVAYNLYRSETSPVTVDPANFVASTPHDVLEYVDWGPGAQGLTNGTEYFYTVTADYGPEGESTGAAEDSAIPMNAVPAPPADFCARLKPDHVKLEWAECHVYDMDYYNVYRKQTGGGTKQEDFVLIATGLEDPHYYDTITSEGIYFYYATVVDFDGAESDPSNQDFVVFGVLPPNSLTAHDGPTFVPVTWMAPGELPEYELVYDDGTNENALALNAAANGLAVRFTPLGYPARVGTLRWFVDDYGLPTAPLTVRIYDDDGPVAGGTILAEATGISAGAGLEWVEYDFSDASITITDGDFYGACIWEIGANPGPTCYVGLDTDGSFEDRTWLIIDSGATWSQDELHQYFPNSEIQIRCSVFGPSRGVIADNVGPATEAMETYDVLHWQEGDKTYTIENTPFASMATPFEIGPRGEPTEHAYFNLRFDPGEEGPENNVVGYSLYKSETPGVEAIPDNLIATVDNEVYEYIDYDVVIATEYFYAATALYQGLEESALSNEDSATPQDDYIAPGPPTDVTAVNTVDLTVHVEWVDPVVDENGFPLDDLTTLTIYRDGAPVGTANPGEMMYDDVCPTSGEFLYYVTASDEVPNESVPSNEVFVVVGDPGYVQDFEADDGGFTTSGSLNEWQWGAPTSGPMGAHSGVNLWGINLAGNYSNNSDSRLTSVAFTAYELCELTFWTWWDTESYYDGWNLKVSTDGGTTWEIVTPDGGYPEDAAYTGNAGIPGEPCYSGHDIGEMWTQCRVDLSSYGSAGGTSMLFRWHFGSDSSVQYPGPYIDDVVIWDATRAMTDVEDGITFMPKRYALNQNRPNPFNPVTEIQFAIPEAGNVRLEVYNLQGQLVKTLVNEARDVGYHSVTWDGTNNNGAQVASGVYFYRIDCNDFGETKKMIILK